MRAVLWFILGVGAVWLLLAGPLALFAADPAQREATLIFSSLAFGICLVPSALTLILSILGLSRPQDQWMVVVGGTGIRMCVTLAVSVGLFMSIDYFRKEEFQGQFWLWILAAYLVTLALETVIVLRMNATSQTPAVATTPAATGEVSHG